MSLNKQDAIRNARAYWAHAAAKATGLVPPRTYVNSTMQGSYTGSGMVCTRPEASNQISSLPMGAQIVRV